MSRTTPLAVLSRREIEAVHGRSVDILESVGMDIGSPSVRRLLLENGAREGDGPQRICVSGDIISKAIDNCPKDYEIAYLDGRRVGMRGAGHLSTCLVDPFINTPDGNRPPLIGDCADAARMLDAMDAVTMPYKMDLKYGDVPDGMDLPMSNLRLFSNFTRHVVCGPMTAADTDTWMEMAEIMAGPQRENPVVTVMVSPSSPLCLHSDVLGILQSAISHGAPVICLPCPMCGLTSPVSAAGTLTVLNAENLMLITIAQLLAPGHPLTYHTVAMPADPASMEARICAPEKMLLSIAAVQMGRFYGLPCGATASATDTPEFDLQNGAESMSHIFPAALSGADLLTGIGSNTNGCGTSPAQIIADLEMLRLAGRFAEGISFDDYDEVVQSIKSVGPGGTFLDDDYSLSRFGPPELFDPETLSWTGRAGGSFLQNCGRLAQRLISKHKPSVNGERLIELGEYVERCAKINRQS